MKFVGLVSLMAAASAIHLGAQPQPGGPEEAGQPRPALIGQHGPPMDGNRPPMDRRGPPMDRPFRNGPEGRWWADPALLQRLGITADQQHRIEAIFQQSRLKLIDLSAVLQKEEAMLEPLLEEDRPDESKVVAQIDRIAQARGELEKANARMLLGFRGVLSQDQWKKLQAEPPRGIRH